MARLELRQKWIEDRNNFRAGPVAAQLTAAGWREADWTDGAYCWEFAAGDALFVMAGEDGRDFDYSRVYVNVYHPCPMDGDVGNHELFFGMATVTTAITAIAAVTRAAA